MCVCVRSKLSGHMFNVKRWTEEDKDQQGIGFSELICCKSKAVAWCVSGVNRCIQQGGEQLEVDCWV